MIQSLYIKNYVLIDELEMQFSEGFTTITGETGAGKSILMGALSLILGQRVDTSVLKLKDSKCIVEGTFKPGDAVRKVFESNDIDFEPVSTLRREIAPGGKSRAFINDTPVNLPLLKEIGTRLVDIHSQHQNLQLNDHLYQLEVIDYLAVTGKELAEYRAAYSAYGSVCQELDRVKDEISKLKEDLDYMQFQFNELHASNLKDGELEALEGDLQRAEHAEEIRNALFQSAGLLSRESTGILDQLKESQAQLQKISEFFTPSKELAQRMDLAYIELKDLSAEVEAQAEKSDPEPGILEHLQERINLLFSLMQKHRVKDLEDLIAIRDQLQQKIDDLTFSDEKINELEKEKTGLLGVMERLSVIMHRKRATAGKEMQNRVELQLRQLGIPNARFKVVIEKKDDYDLYGSDDIRFLFSANKQGSLEEISKVASGGEVSRLMLCIKYLVSDRKGLPTLIFDEIDAGVSGEIADKVGGIMDQLAGGRQVMAITHLPQVASRGSDHFTVYKEDTEDATYTRIRKLEQAERVTEIAKMLSGEEVTDAALSNARVLLRV
ncbi:MAG: DNA repair protein RecN [Bacteroidales bacterium]|nr:DNA repair protein RecN [Bacteroidales bacterium]